MGPLARDCGILTVWRIYCTAIRYIDLKPRKTVRVAPSGAQTTPVARANGVQVIARACGVLRALKSHPEGMSLGELATMLNLPRSTVQRLVEALGAENMVIAASPSRGVRLGPEVLALAQAAKFEVLALARPVLERLSRASGETVDLSIMAADKMVFVDQITGRHRLSAVSAVGVSFPLHACANGKACLAALSERDLLKRLARVDWAAHTPHTITSKAHLLSELERVRAAGVAYDDEENSKGISAVACALRLPGSELAAISIPVPSQRFGAIKNQLTDWLLTQCRQLQAQIGGDVATRTPPSAAAA